MDFLVSINFVCTQRKKKLEYYHGALLEAHFPVLLVFISILLKRLCLHQRRTLSRIVCSHAMGGPLWNFSCSIDGISSWSRSSMKTYPKSSFRRVQQKRRGSKLKRSISFDPDVQIVEYTKEEMDASSDSWVYWFQ